MFGVNPLGDPPVPFPHCRVVVVQIVVTYPTKGNAVAVRNLPRKPPAQDMGHMMGLYPAGSTARKTATTPHEINIVMV